MRRTNVDIGIPLGRENLHYSVAFSLFNLKRTRMNLRIIRGYDCDLVEKRNQIVREFLKGNSDFLLWVDDDQILPPETLTTLVKYNKPVVAPIVTMRQPPFIPVVYRRTINGIENIQKIPDKPFIVDVVGFGVVLMRRDVLEKMEEPFFRWGGFDKHKNRVGEDVYMCDRIRNQLGFPIWVDPQIKVGHLSTKSATIDDWRWYFEHKELFPEYFQLEKKDGE